MSIFVTPEGQAELLNGAPTGVTFKLGSSYGYEPSAGSRTDIDGDLVLAGGPIVVEIASPTVYRYRILLDGVSSIIFGEVALFLENGDLFTLAAFPNVAVKTGNPADLDDIGGYVDVMVQASGEATINIRIGASTLVVDHVHELPSTFDSDTNMAIVANPNSSVSPMMAYRKDAIWSFDRFYQKSSGQIMYGDLTSVTIGGTKDFVIGDLFEFTNTGLIGVTRRVSNVDYTGGNTVLHFATALAVEPADDTFFVQFRYGNNEMPALTPQEVQTAMEGAIADRPETVEATSLLGRADAAVNLQAQLMWVATSAGTGYSVDDVLVQVRGLRANGQMVEFWFNVNTRLELGAAPTAGHVIKPPKEETTVVATCSYRATANSAGRYSINDLVGFTRYLLNGVAVDYWWNHNTRLVLSPAPDPGHLAVVSSDAVTNTVTTTLLVNGAAVSYGNPLPIDPVSIHSFAPRAITLDGSGLGILPSNPHRATLYVHNLLAESIYIRFGTENPTAAAGGYDLQLDPDQTFLMDKLLWQGEVRFFSTAAGSFNVSEGRSPQMFGDGLAYGDEVVYGEDPVTY